MNGRFVATGGEGGAALFMNVLEIELEYVVSVLFMELNGNTTSAGPESVGS